MPRPYHSISSVLLGMRCPRAWAYCYVAGLREPEVAWDDKSAKPRARAAALGKAVHATLESWQTGALPVPRWETLPGQIALSGLHHIPHPDRVHEARVESPIGREPLPPGEDHAPRVAYSLHGVLWAGYRDLLVSAPGEFVRLKINAPDGWALYDYKSTASIERYALTSDELREDPQANLYAAATCDELSLPEISCRWLYLETKRVRRAEPRDATINAADAKMRLEKYAAKARELDTISRVEDAPCNTGACGEYGGCYYHHTNGGPCNARRSVGALIQARVRKRTETMALDPVAKNTFAKFKNGNGAVKTEGPTVPGQVEAPAEENRETIVGPQETPGAPVRRGRPAKKAAPAGGVGATIASLSAELGEAEAARDAANVRVSELLAAIKEACG